MSGACDECEGRGYIIDLGGSMVQEKTCPRCGGVVSASPAPRLEPPAWLVKVALSFCTEDADEDATPQQREYAEMFAQATWDAMLVKGRIETRYRETFRSRYFPQNDRSQEYRVLVFPLESES